MFNLSFINSAFLYGLLLVSAPAIIHLVNKKKAVTLKFPTIRFILASKKRVAKKFKLRQIILLILRTLALLFLVFLFARPLFSSQKNAVDYAAVPKSTVIIIDNSFSMLYKDGDNDFFSSAISFAQDMLTRQKEIDNSALLTTCDITQQPTGELTFKKSELLDKLKEVKVRYTKNNILKSFTKGVELLKPSPNIIKEIYFLSDMQKNGWDDDSVSLANLRDTIKENNISVYLVDIIGKKTIKNVGITSVSVLKERKGKVSLLNIFSKVKNFSKEAIDDVIMKCFIADKEAVKGFVTLKSLEDMEKDFLAPLTDLPSAESAIDSSNIITGYLSLKEDNFTPDDTRYFSLKSFRTVRVLVVDGDPTTQVYKSETFYLTPGLNPLKDKYSKIETNIVTYEGFKKEELVNYDVVILCNVEGVEPSKVQELRSIVKNGGGLIFFLGDKVNPANYNETFGDLLPQKIRDVYTKVKSGSEKPFEYITVKDHTHLILTPFEGVDSGDLSIAKFYKYFVLEPSPESNSNIVLEFSNGNPCLVEKQYFKGKTMLFTSTADRDYNDLCIYPTYLPLLQQMTLYSANALGKEAYTELVVENAADFSVEKDIADVTVVDPTGNPFYNKTKALKERATVRFEETYYPGFYNVYKDKITKYQVAEMKPITTFAVNVSVAESDFTQMDSDALKNIFSDNYNYIKKGDGKGEMKLSLRGEEIWTDLLLFLVAFLIFESIIASTWRKRKEIKNVKWKEGA